jgi:hypothetical protein
MSEYQCYEFVALDRQLTSKEMAELRAISTRADISPTRFWNEYHWGNLKADPAKLVARYFDAHLYFANWGTRRFMLRLPARSVDVAALKPYFTDDRAKLTKAGAFVVLDFWSDDEERGDEEEWFEGGRLAALTPLRAQILQGDLSAAYVAWLGSVQSGAVNDGVREPLVPPGLSNPAAPVASLAELLRVDRDLLAAASEGSAAPAGDAKDLRAWVKARPIAEKDRWLLHAIQHPEAALGAELRATFRKGRSHGSSQPRRTAGELLARAEELREARKAAELVANERAQVAAVRERTKELDRLAKRGQTAWTELGRLIEGRSYDKAVDLAVDLRELAERDGARTEFDQRFASLKKAHARRRGFFDAFKRKESRL